LQLVGFGDAANAIDHFQHFILGQICWDLIPDDKLPPCEYFCLYRAEPITNRKAVNGVACNKAESLKRDTVVGSSLVQSVDFPP
jgi:hypothetical protein